MLVEFVHRNVVAADLRSPLGINLSRMSMPGRVQRLDQRARTRTPAVRSRRSKGQHAVRATPARDATQPHPLGVGVNRAPAHGFNLFGNQGRARCGRRAAGWGAAISASTSPDAPTIHQRGKTLTADSRSAERTEALPASTASGTVMEKSCARRRLSCTNCTRPGDIRLQAENLLRTVVLVYTSIAIRRARSPRMSPTSGSPRTQRERPQGPRRG